MTPEQYWYGHPRLLLNYENKYKHNREVEQQGFWTIGAYVKNALRSTILVATLADEKTKSQLPKYPEFPKFEEVEMTEKQKEAEITRFFGYFKQLQKVQQLGRK